MTRELLTQATLYQPWTLDGPKLDLDGSGAYVIEISELPGFLVAGETIEEVIHELTPALIVHLKAYLAAGRTIPTPQGRAGWTPSVKPLPPSPRVEFIMVDCPKLEFA